MKFQVPYGDEEEGLFITTLACEDPKAPLPKTFGQYQSSFSWGFVGSYSYGWSYGFGRYKLINNNQEKTCETIYKEYCSYEKKRECNFTYETRTTYQNRKKCKTVYKKIYEKKQKCETIYTEDCDFGDLCSNYGSSSLEDFKYDRQSNSAKYNFGGLVIKN